MAKYCGWALNVEQKTVKESIHPNRKQAHVQFWKSVYCPWITIFFHLFVYLFVMDVVVVVVFFFFYVNPDWKNFQNI